MLLEGGGLPRSPSAPRALLGASARSSAGPSHNTCGLPPTNTFRPITRWFSWWCAVSALALVRSVGVLRAR